MKYALDDRPGPLPLLLYGLQWWVVTLPSVVIMGLIVARLYGADAAGQVLTMQKLFALMGAVTIVQPLWGHRLPLVVGPASTLLVGMVAAKALSPDAVYTAMICCGALLALISWGGLLDRLRFFFTPRIVAVILVLIAFTLAPTILQLIFPAAGRPAAHFCFALFTVAALTFCNVRLPGVAKSLTVFFGMAGGSLAYALIFGTVPLPDAQGQADSLPLFINSFDFDPGVILSFIFCFLALTINELGSIESVGRMLKAPDMGGRIRRGAGIQGIANMVSGSLGVIGPVDFSLSAGVIGATGCASRYALVPAGIGLMLCAVIPGAVPLICAMPAPVMGALMLYLMSSQLASGLVMLGEEKAVTDFNSGLSVGLPLMIGLLVAFMPAQALDGLPGLLRPIVGNGFVMGTLAVILLEHVAFRNRGETPPAAGQGGGPPGSRG